MTVDSPNIGDACKLSSTQIVGLTLWAEARGAGADGMTDVASAIMNRTKDHRWPDDPVDVCLQHAQFSCWLNILGNQGEHYNMLMALVHGNLIPEWPDAIYIAARLIGGGLDDTVDGANSYHNANMTKFPNWADPKKITKRTKDFIFYKL